MKKILYVCCNFVWGGVEQYILNVVDYIDKDNFQIDVLLPERDEYEREADLTRREINVIKYPCNSIMVKIKSFMNIIKNGDYDVIHFHTGHESALLSVVCYMAGAKNIVVHAHTTETGDENYTRLHLLKKRLIYSMSNLIYRKIACCVACSREAAQFMFGTYGNKAQILMNGIELERFAKEEKKAIPYSICINARIDTQKNPEFVIDVLKKLVEYEPKIHLEWIGSGPLVKKIEQQIVEYGLEENISLLGVRQDVEKILARNHFFFLPSLYEGLGIVLIEAQAAGLKCFISDTIPESANCGGCFVIPLQYDASIWAQIMISEIKSDNPVKIDEEKLHVFDIRSTVKELEKLYMECCK